MDDEAEEAPASDEEEVDRGRADSPMGSVDTEVLANNLQQMMLMPSVDQANEEERQKLVRMMHNFHEVTATVTRLGESLDIINSQLSGPTCVIRCCLCACSDES